jgi:hypothetical protein
MRGVQGHYPDGSPHRAAGTTGAASVSPASRLAQPRYERGSPSVPSPTSAGSRAKDRRAHVPRQARAAVGDRRAGVPALVCQSRAHIFSHAPVNGVISGRGSGTTICCERRPPAAGGGVGEGRRCARPGQLAAGRFQVSARRDDRSGGLRLHRPGAITEGYKTELPTGLGMISETAGVAGAVAARHGGAMVQRALDSGGVAEHHLVTGPPGGGFGLRRDGGSRAGSAASAAIRRSIESTVSAGLLDVIPGAPWLPH